MIDSVVLILCLFVSACVFLAMTISFGLENERLRKANAELSNKLDQATKNDHRNPETGRYAKAQ